MSVGSTAVTVGPDAVGGSEAATPVEVGVAAAGAALTEAFQHAYRKAPLAGQRRIRFRLPAEFLQEMPRRWWVVGLGHLGQAVLWTTALAGSGRGTTFKLTDYDHVSPSSLSTCLLASAHDVGHKKVDAVGRRLSALGYAVESDGVRLGLAASAVAAPDTLAIVAGDNVGLRRSLDRLKVDRCSKPTSGREQMPSRVSSCMCFQALGSHATCGPVKTLGRAAASISPSLSIRPC